MRIPKKSNIDITYAMVKDGHYQPWEPKYLQGYRDTENGFLDDYARKRAERITEVQVAKPEWFLKQERRARRFVDNLGFTAARGTVIACISASNTKKYKKVMGKRSIKDKYYAVHVPGLGIVVPLEIAEEAYEKSGPIGLSEILSHELTHSAADRSLKSLVRIYDNDAHEWGDYMGRSGVHTYEIGPDGRADKGLLLEEGLAGHFGGLHTRRFFDPSAPLNCITDEPEPERPAFYSDYVPPRADGSPFITGHDAYALEMIAWKAHEMGITPTSDTLIEALYKTAFLDKTLQLEGLRDVPRIINAVKPGLYNELREVPRIRENVIDTMHTVYDLVSK